MHKTLYIHAGTEKTGSTSLQDFLLTSGSLLERRGYHFLRSGGVGATGAMKFTATLCRPKMRLGELPHQNSHVIQRRLIAEVRQSPLKNFIISSEHLHSRVHSPAQLDELKSVFAAAGIERITVIFFIRNQIDLIRSHYSTQVKGGGTRTYREAFTALGLRRLVPDTVTSHGRYDRMLALWSAAFGRENIIVRNYDRTNNVISSFLDVIGIPRETPEFMQYIRPRLNTSLDRTSLFVLANFRNRYPKNHDAHAWLRETLRDTGFKYRTDPMPVSVQLRIWLAFLWCNYRLGREWPELRGLSRKGFVWRRSSWFRKPTDIEMDLLDLLAHLGKKALLKPEAVPTMLLGTRESLGIRGLLHKGLDFGFHKPEEWGCWMKEPVAAMTVNLPACTGGELKRILLRVRCRSFSGAVSGPAQAAVFLNGDIVFRGPVSRTFQDIEIDIPRDAAAPGSANRLLFETDTLVSPSETGESADTRKLGLGISHLELNYLSSGKEPASGADRRTAEERTVIQQP